METKKKVKEHLVGGTLRTLIVAEVKRVMGEKSGHIDGAAVELGITPRTLRVWLKKWPEFQVDGHQMERVVEALR